MRRKSMHDRVMEKVVPEPNSGCWLWSGAVDRDGYGQVRSNGPGWPMLKAHRASYELVCGPIPDGMQIDHLCRNRGCVNPQHLEPVTNQVNNERRPLPEACPRGHAYSPENTGLTRGQRWCRICKREFYRAWINKPGSRERRAAYAKKRYAANQQNVGA